MQQQSPIIVIDDDPLIRYVVCKALKAINLTSIEAENGEEGLHLYREQGADAVLLDVMMPDGMDGYATCAEFRAQPGGQHIPILMMTGLDDLESIDRAYEVGATDFITKPINIPLLNHRLRYMLRASQTTQHLLESERRLHRMAYFDTLTELPNRQFFVEHLQHMISLAKRQKVKLGVLFLDLDDFKRINDTLGHHVGDLVLQETGARLRKCIRASDVLIRQDMDISHENASLARLGGDEFTVMLSMIEENNAAAIVAERIRMNLSQPFKVDNHELFTSSSIGIAIYPDDGYRAEELLKNADMAMYYAKREGGNGYCYFSREMGAAALRRLTLENHLRKAIERNELDLHYQPQLDIDSGKFTGLEALLRWNCTGLGWISPSEFIRLAEGSNLIVSIGEWVLRRACHQVQLWRSRGVAINRIAVNVSIMQLLHKDFPALVKAILAETGLEPRVLELELTESALIKDEESILSILEAIKAIEVKLSIDDFGTGYSSLSRLKDFPIDRLKIDQVFIRNLELDSSNKAIASAVIAMAESLGMKVTAEGVETVAQLAFLKSKQCNEVQGYLLSEPLPADQVEAFFVRFSNGYSLA